MVRNHFSPGAGIPSRPPAALLSLPDLGPSHTSTIGPAVHPPSMRSLKTPGAGGSSSLRHMVSSTRLCFPCLLASPPLPGGRLAIHQECPQTSPPPGCVPSFPWAEVTLSLYSEVNHKPLRQFCSRSLSPNICKMGRIEVRTLQRCVVVREHGKHSAQPHIPLAKSPAGHSGSRARAGCPRHAASLGKCRTNGTWC